MLTTAWAGGRTADKSSVEAQTVLPLSLSTRDQARAALARAFEEAAVMPGRLLADDALFELGTGLFLRDIGKLALPPNLVLKAGPLAPDEWDLMMQHPL